MISREGELKTLAKLNALIESRTHQQGDVIIQKGEKNRDLFFLTEGFVEISTKEKDGNVILNEFSAPNIIGDIGFLFGFPRTATARAKTKVKVYVLKYEKMMQEISKFPDWLSPLLSSFVSGMKALHDEARGLKRKRNG